MHDPARGARNSEVLEELLPSLTANEASVEAARCLMCFDAPCTHACPTHIDIPKFIKKISTGNLRGSARTILESNLLGATCARVCPVQELCEGACVLGAEHKPISIGRLQRYAMDHINSRKIDMFRPAAPKGKSVAVIGGGPAGLSCAGELAKHGYSVTLFEKRDFAGGLSTYGIIGLREPVDVALAEVEMIRHLGVQVESGKELGANLDLAELQSKFDSIFMGVGGHFIFAATINHRNRLRPQPLGDGRAINRRIARADYPNISADDHFSRAHFALFNIFQAIDNVLFAVDSQIRSRAQSDAHEYAIKLTLQLRQR